MDHYKNPQNKGLIDNDNYEKVHLYNPSCGDDITVQVVVENNIVKDIRQDGTGCSICCSSASVASQALKGLDVEVALNKIDAFYNMLMDKTFDYELLKGDALAFSGVKDFPARIRCATLGWKAIEEAILKQKEK